MLSPDWNLIGTDCHDIMLSTLRGNVCRDALAQDIFLQRHTFQFDARVFRREIVGQLLHPDHVAFVHPGDGQFLDQDGRCHL